MALIITGYRRLHCIWQLRRAPAIEAPELELLLSDLARRLQVPRATRLLVTTGRIGPAVVGLPRPLIVLPEIVIRDKQPEELEAILAHELIHVRRGDLWVGALQVCARAIWWCYPVVWWVSRQSSLEAERCCDEEVIGELGCDPRCYARSLLDVLELKRSLVPVPSFPGMKPVEVTSQRLERIMNLGQGCHKRTPRSCWVTMLVLAAVALPGAAIVGADHEADLPSISGASQLKLVEINTAEGETVGTFVDKNGQQFTFYGSGRGDGIKSSDNDLLSLPRPPRPIYHGGPASPAESQVSHTYTSHKTISALKKELNCDRSQALRTFAAMLMREARLDSGSPEKHLRLESGAVTILASAEQHDRMAAAVERMELYGAEQLILKVCFVSVPEQVVNATIKDWELTPLGNEQLREPKPFDRPLPTAETRPVAKAGMTTTPNLPPVYKIVDAKEARKIVNKMRDNRAHVLGNVTMSLFNGQSVTLVDTTQRPFVVGLKKVEGENAIALQPQIHVVESGRTVGIRPLLRDSNKVWLDYDIRNSDIADVQIRTVTAAGFDEPLTLQVPTVHTARIESAVEFELGKTVIIGGLPAELVTATKQQLLVLVTATRPDKSDQGGVAIDHRTVTSVVRTVWLVANSEIVLASDKQTQKLVPILGPATYGDDSSIDPPTKEQVLAALDLEQAYGLPQLQQIDRSNVRITKEKIADYVDPPRFVPHIGPAQLHHAHYKCTIFCDQQTSVGWPVPHKTKKEAEFVVYIDHNHFHLVARSDDVFKMVYNVADLLPAITHFANGTGPAVADFEKLVDLITSTIEPDS
jgi:hypothetical protein